MSRLAAQAPTRAVVPSADNATEMPNSSWPGLDRVAVGADEVQGPSLEAWNTEAASVHELPP